MKRSKRKKRAGVKTGQFKSKLEKRVAGELRRTPNILFRYEADVFKYVIEKYYVSDFTITPIKQGASPIFIEVKGYFSAEDRTKMRAVKATNPHADIRLVFDRDNKLSRQSKMTYSQWAEKNGFKYSVGKIPKGWFE